MDPTKRASRARESNSPFNRPLGAGYAWRAFSLRAERECERPARSTCTPPPRHDARLTFATGRLVRAPQRRDDHSLRAEATNRTLPRRGLHPTQLGQRRVGHVAPRRVGVPGVRRGRRARGTVRVNICRRV